MDHAGFHPCSSIIDVQVEISQKKEFCEQSKRLPTMKQLLLC